ncbi:hypothetical protein EMIHUDRAFT_96903 [Emiliania huxleyi CCMP1516]|uniref:Glycoside hydrolase family 2 catalytic domain-containing protein n=2 Tax=Emiliania huxleyi TaxID=2903 RepID=A0A0D3I6Z3_EMIH1|nr:hypothetical protein EMIHUDRAFT_96903 [Emiliania huxleyi CCMP1516]EOD07028.1 hypothetical protein EMIHUDRAFT_96903 [Emiliania huxleyi CCMP1516]|eukprot:XP_005759457.1 hypothetical protein EMIHUDRAFT_96903 [Emiliania huxleyi CCMP1516]
MLLLCFLSLSAPRDEVSFDFGWRFTTGLSTHPAQSDEPPPASADPGLHPAEAQTGYDDSGWAEVQLPHDGLIAAAASSAACRDGCSGKSYIPRHVLWYRKAFTLPAEWAGSLLFLDFEGSFRKTTAHDCGYTPFRVRLDNATSLRRRLGSGDSAHTIAVFVDPDNGDEGARSHGSGWWYEGGGLYRSVALLRVPPLHIERDGLFAYSNLSWRASGGMEEEGEQEGEQPSGGVLHASAAVANAGSSAQTICVAFSLSPPGGGRLLAAASTAAVSVPPGGRATVSLALSVAEPEVWSAASPHLYTVHAAVMQSGCASSSSSASASSSSSSAAAASLSDGVVDAVSTTHGFRSLRYDADAGFFLNQRHFKVRGFCDHNSFAVVGMAVPPRVDLFRAQALRVVVMDENRLFANSSKYVANMGALVRRDRNHPSVVIWSFCNEAGCEGWRERGGPRFQEVAHRLDGSRPTLANMFTFDDLLSHTVDVQGFSHQSRQKLDACHARLPDKPIYMSECCSCETLRDNPHTACTQKSFNARCAESNTATNASDGAAYAVGDMACGTMVWTLFDYYGEPPVGGFEVSSSYGQYDLCGFPKAAASLAAASWYRTQWLLGVPDGPDKP